MLNAMGNKSADAELLETLNREEVHRQIPLMVYLLIICLTGIPGNGLVCYIYKSEYQMSSSKWFIFFLSAVDIILCLVILPCEFASVFRQYTFSDPVWCKFTAFFNLLMLISIGLTLLVVTIDRYRKVCKPLSWQINFKKARVLCVVCCVIALLISCPVFVVYDIHEFSIGNVTARECSFRKSLENSSLTFYYVCFGMFIFIAALFAICVLYCVIGKHIKDHINKEKMKRHISLTASMARKDNRILPVGKATCARGIRFDESDLAATLPVANKTVKLSTELATQSASTNDINRICANPVHLSLSSATSAEWNDSPAERSDLNETTEDSQSNTFFYEEEGFQKPKISLNKTQETKSKRIRRARARKATFSMCLISIAFVVSYLPFLSLLLVRTLLKDFENSLSDNSRAMYKFFLRSGYLNCAINPFIYGISDKSFRLSCKNALRSLYDRIGRVTRFRVN